MLAGSIAAKAFKISWRFAELLGIAQDINVSQYKRV